MVICVRHVRAVVNMQFAPGVNRLIHVLAQHVGEAAKPAIRIGSELRTAICRIEGMIEMVPRPTGAVAKGEAAQGGGSRAAQGGLDGYRAIRWTSRYRV